MSSIYHLITHNQWEASKHQNTHEADTLATEGFIHCSATVEQLLRVANRLYSDRPDMLALVINTNQLTYQLKEEPSRSGEIYPHIYGPLNISAVTETLEFIIESGIFVAVRPSPNT